jgi:hypothetical protein
MCEQAVATRNEWGDIERQWEDRAKVDINLNGARQNWCPATVIRTRNKSLTIRFEQDYYRIVQESFLFFKWNKPIYFKKGELWDMVPQEGRNIRERF